MRADHRQLLRGLAKLVAVVVASGLAGAGIGIALAALTGSDSASEPLVPATGSTTSGVEAATSTKARPVYRVPRVEVRSAQIGPISRSTGGATVTVRVRVTNRGNRRLTIKAPMLVSAGDEVPLAAGARDAAGALLRPIRPGSSAVGVLRFDAPSAVAKRLEATPSARLRVANRTVSVRLSQTGTSR